MSAAPTIAAATSTASIELRNLHKRFGGLVAVEDLSLTVAKGEFLTLLGPSGCGKTTTLRMIGGFELPTSGTIAIGGDDMGQLPPYRRPVNTVFQNYALFPHLTVGQNVGYGLEMARVAKGERMRRVGEALEMVRLPGVEDRKPAELSGGQQQRVALARALVNRPRVLLLDEPLGALDLKLRKAMQLELKALNQTVGATFVYVTHDQEEALTMSDRIAVMSAGKILQLGTPDDIYERPRSRFVADFIGQTNFLAGTIGQVIGEQTEVAIPGSGVLRGHLSDREVPTGAVTLAIRPEKIVLIQDQATVSADWNIASGVVADLIYLGTHTHVTVALPGGAIVTVHYQNQTAAAQSAAPRPGTEVRLAFAPANATVLPPG